jgi:hypothetical protein
MLLVLVSTTSSSPNWTMKKYIPAAYWIRLTNSADVRGIEFQLTIDYLEALYESQQFRCALTGFLIDFGQTHRDIWSASVDRIDPNLCYTPGNVQWVHKDVNRMKWAFSQDDFIEICSAVVAHQAQLKGLTNGIARLAFQPGGNGEEKESLSGATA